MSHSALLDDLFADVEGNPVAQAERLRLFKAAGALSEAETAAGRTRIDFAEVEDGRQFKVLRKAPAGYAEAVGDFASIVKSFGGNTPAELADAFGRVEQWIQKDWTPTNPIAGNMYPYDLEEMAKQLWPRDTPFRNTIPRDRGQGGAREYMRILSVSNAGVPGGAPDLLIGFNSQTQTSNWGSAPVVLNRPKKISYTGDRKSALYMELGVSDAVSFVSYFKGLGFDNQRTLSRTALLWAHLLGEEKLDLYGRGTAAGYAGAVAAPTGVTAVGAASGGFIGAGTYSVYVAAYTGTGYSAVSSVATTAALSGSTNTITVAIPGEPTGALAYGVWVGTVAGIANAKFQGLFAGQPILLTTYNAAGSVTTGTDTSADATVYDGFLTIASDPNQSGYFKRINAAWNSTRPGAEIDAMLTGLYVSYGARPDELWMDGVSRTNLGQLMRTGGATANGYRTNVIAGTTNATMSTTVTGFANPNTGQVLDINTHRFMPVGNCFARSRSVPFPDAHMAAPSTKVNVQEYMALEWPLLQMSYDQSTYQIGTLVHQAPMLHGLLTGIQ